MKKFLLGLTLCAATLLTVSTFANSTLSSQSVCTGVKQFFQFQNEVDFKRTITTSYLSHVVSSFPQSLHLGKKSSNNAESVTYLNTFNNHMSGLLNLAVFGKHNNLICQVILACQCKAKICKSYVKTAGGCVTTGKGTKDYPYFILLSS